MAVPVRAENRAKVSVTVASELLRVVDEFVRESPAWDRSKVFDEALRLWCTAQQEAAIIAQHQVVPSDLEREERTAWRQIQTAAAERLFRDP